MPVCLLLAPVHSSGSARLFPAWRGISLCFSGIRCQLHCPESLCPESLFPHHLSSHTCLFSSSSSTPDFLLSLFFLCVFKSSLGLDAEAKVVKVGRERIYSFNHRDPLNVKKKKKITVVLLQFWYGKDCSLLSVRDTFFRALTANLVCPLGYVIAQNVLVFFCWKDCALCNSLCSDLSSQPSGSSKGGRKANFHMKEKEISITEN